MVEKDELESLVYQLKEKGDLTDNIDLVNRELDSSLSHTTFKRIIPAFDSFYDQKWSDFLLLHDTTIDDRPYLALQTLDGLLERDQTREGDGFKRKIQVGKVAVPSRGGSNKVVIIPQVIEDKLVHERNYDEETGEGMDSAGTGEQEEGEVIGESPMSGEGNGNGNQPGGDENGDHQIETDSYSLGKILTQKFELPNLEDKGKKKFLEKYSYELTDKNAGSGQILDYRGTIEKIIQTNMALGKIKDINNIDPTKLLVDHNDMIYRILSRERDYESQALVFFVRDYSGSMDGPPAEIVTTQHVFIHAWLTYQYKKRIKERFVVHDTGAKELPDFETYYRLSASGGTMVHSGLDLVNEIVEKENLANDYNIYVCYGTDGDDWGNKGNKAIDAFSTMLTYANRIGITVVRNSYGSGRETTVEEYMNESGLLDLFEDKIRMDVMKEGATQERIIEGIRELFSDSDKSEQMELF